MRKFSVATLLVKLVCLQVLCQPLSVLAESGSGGGVAEECAGDPTKYALDANGDEVIDLGDVIWSLSWMFRGGQVPRVCLDSTDLEASFVAAEGERDVALAELTVALADLTTTQGALTTAEAAQATAEGERAAAQLAQATAEAAQATAEGERDTAQAAQAAAEGERDVALGERDAAQAAQATA